MKTKVIDSNTDLTDQWVVIEDTGSILLAKVERCTTRKVFFDNGKQYLKRYIVFVCQTEEEAREHYFWFKRMQYHLQSIQRQIRAYKRVKGNFRFED